ncbi:GDYXXLXY domain-containing protein [Pelagicoccus sp. SDUM812003]|uniref:GDYXXLXY domain-containing protein n=1 Tax=Pelagicoccus sp. SDUM812003 TaxID=3041267 RepID=UPI00280D9898|nr:GDYXXLXY domain-containing protein [Pelagicoccus sp. SDUM812003]MDQ8204439.1 GDYXXLXY domain-containing protein [Pelagicoccus sp. SDUM812003]
MRPNRLSWLFLALGAALCFGFPVSTIWKQTQILQRGVSVKFSLRPVDPYDPFRGRYIWLNFDLNRAPASEEDPPLEARGAAYLSLQIDDNGFADAGFLSASPPSDGLYLRVENVHSWLDGLWAFSLPFDRYYLNESDAKRVEEIAREELSPQQDEDANARRMLENYLRIRILDGEAAIEGYYLGGETVETRLARPTPIPLHRSSKE